jgi:Anti-sigma-K factor rskA
MSDELEPELERIAGMLANAGPLPDAPATLRDRVGAIPDGGVPQAPGLTAVAPRTRRRPRRGALLGIAAVVAAIVIVPTVVIVHESGGGGERSIELASRPFAPNGGGDARVVAHGDGSATISLRVWKMPQPGAGNTYEAWLGRTGDRKALGTFSTDNTGAATISFTVPRGEMDAYRWLWVTSEPVGGSPSPSKRTALWGPLT